MRRSHEALAIAECSGDLNSRALARAYGLASLQFLGDTSELDARTQALEAIATEHGFELFKAWFLVFRGWVEVDRGDFASGAARMEQGLEAWRSTGTRLLVPYVLELLAEAHLRSGHAEAAGSWLAKARTQVEQSDERWWEAEIYRLEGEVLLATGADRPGEGADAAAPAEACFEQAISTAREQGARSLELRAGLSLSRLSSRGKPSDASRRLSAVLAGFTEGHDTRDLRAARAHLAALSSGD